jgi:hypothetical protein
VRRRDFITGLGALAGGAALTKIAPMVMTPFPKVTTSVIGQAAPAAYGVSRLESAAGRIEDFEAALEYLWSNYKVAPDYIFLDGKVVGPFMERRRIAASDRKLMKALQDVREIEAKKFRKFVERVC